nr:hypothetical protein [uncultured Desulfobulbus sp.]
MKTTCTTPARNHSPKKLSHIPSAWANIDHELRAFLESIGVTNPQRVNTRQASAILTYLGIPTADSSLEVYRCQGRGPKYCKVASRVFYALPWLIEHAQGVEIKIFDPSEN